ncbi:MAG: cytochrome c [Burkholderiaceae bacterium]|jgi:mono/diheme cytochrome c family protein|nr:cytochrome c [Burkholderiaceae bacterium]
MKRRAAVRSRAWSALLAGGGALVACAATAWAQELQYPKGAQVFQTQCVVCHQAKGAGLAGLAPPLTRNPGRYATLAEGRRHLAMMTLYGMFGEITVDGKPFNFKMPSFSQLGDEDLAAVLNYVAFDIAQAPASAAALTAADIAAVRATPMTGEAVRQHRAEILKTLEP